MPFILAKEVLDGDRPGPLFFAGSLDVVETEGRDVALVARVALFEAEAERFSHLEAAFAARRLAGDRLLGFTPRFVPA